MKKLTATAAIIAATLATAACAPSNDTTTKTVEKVTVTESAGATEATTASATATETATVTEGATTAQGEVPNAIAGYTDKARQELTQEQVTEEDVAAVLEAVKSKTAGAKAEWDNDGHWELSYQDIDVDIQPDGTVIGVDR